MSTTATVTTIPPCDFDATHGPAYADFKTSFGPWANGCEDCFRKYGGRLGTGYGQKLVVKDAA